MDDAVFDLLTQLVEDADVSRSRLLEQMVGQDHEGMNGLRSWRPAPRLALASSWNLSCSWGATRMNYLRTWLSRLGRMKGSSWST